MSNGDRKQKDHGHRNEETGKSIEKKTPERRESEHKEQPKHAPKKK